MGFLGFEGRFALNQSLNTQGSDGSHSFGTAQTYKVGTASSFFLDAQTRLRIINMTSSHSTWKPLSLDLLSAMSPSHGQWFRFNGDASPWTRFLNKEEE